MRKHTNTHVTVGVNGKGVHASPTRVRTLNIRQSGRMLGLLFGQFSKLGCYFRRMQIESYDLLRGKPDGERALRTINTWIDQRIEFELQMQFLLRELPHGQDFVFIDSGRNSFEFQW